MQCTWQHLAIISDSAPRCTRNVQSNYHSVDMSDYIYIVYGITYIEQNLVSQQKQPIAFIIMS